MSNYVSDYSGLQIDNIIGLFQGKGLDQVNGLVQRNSDGTFSQGSAGGTVTSVATGVGLTGGPVTSSGTIKAKLASETSQGTIGTTNKLYAVGVDSTGALCTSVPWTDTTYESKTATSSGTDVSLVTTGEKFSWNNKQDLLTAGSGVDITNNVISSEYIPYITSIPTSANTDGLKFVVLSSEPTTKYAGWVYLIKES